MSTLRISALFLWAILLPAQQTGVAPPSQTAKLFTDLAAQARRLQPLIQKIKPNEWTGAPASYTELWQTALKANQSVITDSSTVARTPEKIADSVRLLEEVHTSIESLSELLVGLDKYGNPALAELIVGILGETRPAREAFSERVMDIVNERDEQFATADHEAQRCREILSKDPHAAQRR